MGKSALLMARMNLIFRSALKVLERVSKTKCVKVGQLNGEAGELKSLGIYSFRKLRARLDIWMISR